MLKFTDLNFKPHPHYRGDGIQAKHFSLMVMV